MDMVAYYETNFAMVNHHGWSLEEIENLMPWERDVYSTLLVNYLRVATISSLLSSKKF